MNKTVKIIGVAICASILAFAVFQIAMYMWADQVFNEMFGGHLYTDYDTKKQQLDELQAKSQALVDDFNSR